MADNTRSMDVTALKLAAIAVHHVLVRHKFEHAFLGGFAIFLMGSNRATKDIDVEVEKPFYHGFEKIRDAFKASPEFFVFDDLREDGVRELCLSLDIAHLTLVFAHRFAPSGRKRSESTSSCVPVECQRLRLA